MLDNKKSLLVATLLIIVACEVRAQNTALETYGLKGPVKSLLTETKKGRHKANSFRVAHNTRFINT